MTLLHRTNYKVLLTIIGLFFLQSLQAQTPAPSTWAAPGATWHYSYNLFMYKGYKKLAYTGDTTIQGKTCKMLHKTGEIHSQTTDSITSHDYGYEYMYLENDSLYRYRDNAFHFIYSLDAQVGDSVYVYDTSSLGYHAIAVVDSIGTMTINGETLKWQHVSNTQNSVFGLEGKILNRIGPIEWYMFGEHMSDGHEGGPFRCYSDTLGGNSFVYEPYSLDCDYTVTTSIQKLALEKNKLKLYPVPTQQTLTIELDMTNFNSSELYIYSALGQLISVKTLNSTISNIDVSHLPAGQYWAVLRTENQNSIKKTFLID